MYMNMENIITMITRTNVAVDMTMTSMTITTIMMSMNTIMMNVDVITTTTSMSIITIMKDMSITMTTMINAVVDMTMMSMSIITSIIMTTTMNAAADMITTTITIIMQMKYLQAGDARQLRSIQEKDLRKCSKLFLHLKITVSSFVQKECFRQKMEHGSTLIWFRKKQKSVRVHRNILAVSA